MKIERFQESAKKNTNAAKLVETIYEQVELSNAEAEAARASLAKARGGGGEARAADAEARGAKAETAEARAAEAEAESEAEEAEAETAEKAESEAESEAEADTKMKKAVSSRLATKKGGLGKGYYMVKNTFMMPFTIIDKLVKNLVEFPIMAIMEELYQVGKYIGKMFGYIAKQINLPSLNIFENNVMMLLWRKTLPKNIRRKINLIDRINNKVKYQQTKIKSSQSKLSNLENRINKMQGIGIDKQSSKLNEKLRKLQTSQTQLSDNAAKITIIEEGLKKGPGKVGEKISLEDFIKYYKNRDKSIRQIGQSQFAKDFRVVETKRKAFENELKRFKKSVNSIKVDSLRKSTIESYKGWNKTNNKINDLDYDIRRLKIEKFKLQIENAKFAAAEPIYVDVDLKGEKTPGEKFNDKRIEDIDAQIEENTKTKKSLLTEIESYEKILLDAQITQEKKSVGKVKRLQELLRNPKKAQKAQTDAEARVTRAAEAEKAALTEAAKAETARVAAEAEAEKAADTNLEKAAATKLEKAEKAADVKFEEVTKASIELGEAKAALAEVEEIIKNSKQFAKQAAAELINFSELKEIDSAFKEAELEFHKKTSDLFEIERALETSLTDSVIERKRLEAEIKLLEYEIKLTERNMKTYKELENTSVQIQERIEESSSIVEKMTKGKNRVLSGLPKKVIDINAKIQARANASYAEMQTSSMKKSMTKFGKTAYRVLGAAVFPPSIAMRGRVLTLNTRMYIKAYYPKFYARSSAVMRGARDFLRGYGKGKAGRAGDRIGMVFLYGAAASILASTALAGKNLQDKCKSLQGLKSSIQNTFVLIQDQIKQREQLIDDFKEFTDNLDDQLYDLNQRIEELEKKDLENLKMTEMIISGNIIMFIVSLFIKVIESRYT